MRVETATDPSAGHSRFLQAGTLLFPSFVLIACGIAKDVDVPLLDRVVAAMFSGAGQEVRAASIESIVHS